MFAPDARTRWTKRLLGRESQAAGDGVTYYWDACYPAGKQRGLTLTVQPSVRLPTWRVRPSVQPEAQHGLRRQRL